MFNFNILLFCLEKHISHSQILLFIEHIYKSNPLPKDDAVIFDFGCETDMDRFCRIGIPPGRFPDFKFVIIPTTHLHMNGFTITDEDAESNARRAELWVKRFEALLDMSLPFGKIGIAHRVPRGCPCI